MQKLITIIGAILLAFSSCAETYISKDKWWRYEIDDDGNVTMWYIIRHSVAETVVVPEWVLHNGRMYCVTAIGKEAFKGRKELKKVVVGGRVGIKDSAFVNCPQLESVCYKVTEYWYSMRNSNVPYNNISPKAVVDCPKFIPSTETDAPKTARLRITDEDGTVRYAESDCMVITLDSTDLDKKIEVVVEGCEVESFAVTGEMNMGNILIGHTGGSELSDKDKERLRKLCNGGKFLGYDFVYLTEICAYKDKKKRHVVSYMVRVR